jgi:glycosyltransferase involved in cell wall biosynthesis
MNAFVEGDAGRSSKPVILHLVGGDYALGGLMSFVREICGEPLPGFDQFVWKHRKYPIENSTTVSRGWSRNVDRSAAEDLVGAVLDLIPLYFWLRRRKPLLILAHTRMGVMLSVFPCLLFRRPVVVYVHAQNRNTSLYRFLWRMTRATVVFNSRPTCRHFGYDLKTSHIIPPPILWPSAQTEGSGKFVASSQIVRWKNVHLIIAAFLRMAKEGRSLHIYGFSANPPEPDYQDEIVRLAKPHSNICLHQWDPSWTDSLGVSDIFVHAAEKEPFGIVLLEAYARGCRMAAPQGTFLDELPSSGVFKSAASVDDLAQAMTEACNFPVPNDLWRQRKEVAHLFSLANARQELSKIYRAKLNGA